MCVLFLVHRKIPGYPVVVAANRDESYDRPGTPPEYRIPEPIPGRSKSSPYLAPRDPRAGGTWLGATKSGLFVGITNRRKPEGQEAAERSRGLLVHDLLEEGSIKGCLEQLESEVDRRKYDPFNLMVADARTAWVAHFDGTLRVSHLEPGAYVLMNDEDVDPSLAATLMSELEPAEDLFQKGKHDKELIASLSLIARDHRPRLAGDLALCKHGEGRGTTSSSLILLPEEGEGLFLFADGSPCVCPFKPFRWRP